MPFKNGPILLDVFASQASEKSTLRTMLEVWLSFLRQAADPLKGKHFQEVLLEWLRGSHFGSLPFPNVLSCG